MTETAVHPLRREARLTLRLAAPIAAAQIGQVLMGIVDTAVVGHAGERQLAGVSCGNGIAGVVSLFALGLALGLDPVATQRVGAGDHRGAWRALMDTLRLSVVAIPLLAGLNWLLTSLVTTPNLGPSFFPRWFPMDRDVAETAQSFAWVRMPGALAFMMYGAYRAWFYANHSTRPLILAIAFANVINFVLDYVFVFGDAGLARIGLPSLGIPALGAVGAGIVTSTVSLLIVAMLAPLAARKRRAQLGSHAPAAGDVPSESRAVGMLRIARLGLPTAATIFLEAGIFYLIGWRMGVFGTTAQAAQQIALQVVSATFIVAMSVGVAATVRVGHAIGAGDTPGARLAGFTAFLMSFGWMGCCGVVLLLAPEAVAALFNDDPALIAATAPLLRIGGLFQIFDGLQATACGALRGVGDTRMPLLANLGGYWVVGLPLAEWLAFRRNFGANGLWYGLTFALAIVAVLLVWRFARITRRTIQRVG